MFLQLLIAGHFQTYQPKLEIAEQTVKEETVQIIEKTEEPEPEEPEPAEPTLEEKIKSNYYNCDVTTQYIRADNAQCLDKPVYKPQSTKKAATGAQNASQSLSQSKGNTYSPGYCTWGVKNWVSWVPNGWGNGNQWASRARAQGYTVGSNPRVGDVAAARSYNHVAVVVGVGKGTVTIKEMNYKGRYSVNTRTTSIAEWLYIRP